MARTVDREQRRLEILEGFHQYVGRVGLHGATSRGLAREMGMAAGSLWNYFENFDELIVEAYRSSFEPLEARLSVHDAEPGLDGLARAVSEMLPMTEFTQEEGDLSVAFMGNMGRHPELYAIQARIERVMADHIRLHLEAAQRDGDLKPEADVARLTEVLLVVVIGLQMQWVVPGSHNRTPEAQWRVLSDTMRPWLADGVEVLESPPDLSDAR
ncbi:TetR/AcrR family transcriptional regulator [Gulosibacter molinativorax]|uniref:TetR/AcrR family transcriptional regulator n=1 Tax=Gulosibacter molinativorax TaxID=256821 RepID=A0ABT7CCA2_9MICO|nr:TetR family transcriptional regulator C-terminal domain-containing protein [Gulosibacter molinativorax]MDJ1372256.1 TetR/AcrR family transcriptional regulator [Gulosibacter molinativorax]QUY63459.1 Hypotetical protein [Gulosibacter molinativorax]